VLQCHIPGSDISYLTGLPLNDLPNGFLFLLLHGLATAGNSAGASLGDNHLSAALGTAITFTYLICHFAPPFCDFISSIIIQGTPVVKAEAKFLNIT
jgi:hypothetical protein